MTLSANALPLVDARTVRAFLNDGREIALVDVREAGQFGEGHPFFAIPLPYSRLELDARVNGIQPQTAGYGSQPNFVR